MVDRLIRLIVLMYHFIHTLHQKCNISSDCVIKIEVVNSILILYQIVSNCCCFFKDHNVFSGLLKYDVVDVRHIQFTS